MTVLCSLDILGSSFLLLHLFLVNCFRSKKNENLRFKLSLVSLACSFICAFIGIILVIFGGY